MKKNKYRSLTNIQICLTGFDDPDILLIKEKIESAGGIYSENLSKKTNYLISDKINTKKSLVTISQYKQYLYPLQAAQDQRIKIVTKDWIYDENDDKYLNVKKTTIKCFHNLPVFIFGYDESTVEYQSIASKIEEFNGKIVYNTIEADVIIFKKGLFLSERELIEIEKCKDKIVIEDWVDSCINAKRFLDLNQSKFQLKHEILQNKFDELEQSILSLPNKRSNLFGMLIFYISSDFDIETKVILTRAVSLGSGIIFSKITPLTTHIICSSNYDDYKGETEYYNSSNCPVRITVNWVFDALRDDYLKPYEDYRPVESFLLSNDPNEQGIKRSQRQLVLSNIFINETFTIYKGTYIAEEYQTIKEKIIENSGKVIESNSDDFTKEINAKYIIMNDGYGILLNQLLPIVNSLQSNHVVISHRFLDICIEKRKIVDLSDYLTLFPFTFKVPHFQMIKNKIQIYVPSSYYSFSEKNSYESLIETLGGKVDLNNQTTHVLLNKEIKKKDLNKIKKRSNDDIHIVTDDWLIEFILNGKMQPEEKYLPQLID